MSVSVPNLPLVRGLDDHSATSVAISLQSALLGIDDRSGDTPSAQTLARRLGLSPDIAKLLTPSALADRGTSDAATASDPVAAQLDRSVAADAAPAVQPPGVPRSQAGVTPSPASIAPTAQPKSEPAARVPPPAAPVAPLSHPKSDGGNSTATPSQPSPPSQQPPAPPAGQAPPADPPATAPAADPPVTPPAADGPSQDPVQTPPVQDAPAPAAQDADPPVIEAHADLVAEAGGPSGAAVSYTTPTASDAVDGAVGVSCTPASGSTFAIGHTTVTCSAHDAAGNQAPARSFDVDVRDTTAPVIQIPADIAVAATSPAGAAVSFTATATDAVDGTDVVACGPSSGTTFAVGQTTVTCTAGDAAGNEAASQSFSVFVTATQAHSDDVHALLGIDAVLNGLGLSHPVEQGLHGQLIDAATADVNGDAVATCQAFDAFTASASAELTPEQLATLTPSIDAARTTLGC